MRDLVIDFWEFFIILTEGINFIRNIPCKDLTLLSILRIEKKSPKLPNVGQNVDEFVLEIKGILSYVIYFSFDITNHFDVHFLDWGLIFFYYFVKSIFFDDVGMLFLKEVKETWKIDDFSPETTFSIINIAVIALFYLLLLFVKIPPPRNHSLHCCHFWKGLAITLQQHAYWSVLLYLSDIIYFIDGEN